MKMTRYALLNGMEVLNKFSFVNGELGYAVAKTKANMKDCFKEFADIRQKILEKYGQQDEKGEWYVDENSESYADYTKEIFETVDQVIEVEISTVPKDVFRNSDIYNPNCTTLDYEVFARLMIG